MEVTLESELIDELTAACGEENMILAADKVGKLSKDFYWYSPVLKPMLDDKTPTSAATPLKSKFLSFKKQIPIINSLNLPIERT